ncbi:MAG: aminotransferase class V-fold PLP-dependent enzyme [Acidimicrobiia bacterium]|nr:aminotransferase class V-fold PLP-dependent enzyme [Acidimicrobiia bacterium]
MARLASQALRYAIDRIRMDPPPLDSPIPYEQMLAEVGETITPSGIGGAEALRIYTEILAPTCISVDHPKFLSFVPGAPTEASIIFDMVVSAGSIYTGSWLEGAGAVFAENQALRWIADLAHFPESAGGVFVSGGTAGNLSALIAARHRWRERAQGRHDRTRGLMVASSGAHSSVKQAARAMDADIVVVPADAQGRLNRDALRNVIAALDPVDIDRLFAIVATSGTTNLGVVDDLAAVADVAGAHDVWFHVDGAYGAAALCAPSVRHLFEGIERADSFIVDPHKWLFGPYDSCALIYRNIHDGRRAHTQHAEYLDVLHGEQDESKPWLEMNPADVAHHLSRRARGLPLWFSLATHGSDAYTKAMEKTLDTTRFGADEIRRRPYLELLLEPDLSIIVFRRVGWTPEQYQKWSDTQLYGGQSFVVPSSWNGETVLRFCIVNPRTTNKHLVEILDSMEEDPA